MASTTRLLFGFALMACSLSWLCWWPLVLLGPGGASSPLKYLHLLGSLGPATSALAMAWITGRKEAIQELLRRICRWRVSTIWHIFAWSGPFAVLAAAQAIAHVLGPATDVAVLHRSMEYPELSLPAYWLSVLFFYGFGEEIGWRGFALPILQSRFHPAIATLIVTAIWALWHLPLFLFSPGFSSLGLGGGIGWLLSLLTGSFILTWLFNKAQGSILVVAGFHATMDIAFLAPPLVMQVVGIITTLIGTALTFAVILSRDTPIVLKVGRGHS